MKLIDYINKEILLITKLLNGDELKNDNEKIYFFKGRLNQLQEIKQVIRDNKINEFDYKNMKFDEQVEYMDFYCNKGQS